MQALLVHEKKLGFYSKSQQTTNDKIGFLFERDHTWSFVGNGSDVCKSRDIYCDIIYNSEKLETENT